MSRAIGDYDMERGAPRKLRGISAEADVTCTELQDKDCFVILACDGVWDVLSNQSAVDHAWKHLANKDSPDHAAEQLVAYTLKRGSTDNVSAIVVRLGKSSLGPSKEEFKEKALALQREGKYIPLRLRQYLK